MKHYIVVEHLNYQVSIVKDGMRLPADSFSRHWLPAKMLSNGMTNELILQCERQKGRSPYLPPQSQTLKNISTGSHRQWLLHQSFE